MALPLKLNTLSLAASSTSRTSNNIAFSSPHFKTINIFSWWSQQYYFNKVHVKNSLISLSQERTSNSTFRLSYRYCNEEDGVADDAADYSFKEAIALFNKREYYKCHDFLEALWMKAEEPTKTLVHGMLQCAVGFYHLFNQNHKGAMLELGEGLCKLRKMNFQSGPFHQFEQEISTSLEFIYQTQMELAACKEDLCVTMDQSEKSYQLLDSYGAGQHLYSLQNDATGVMYIVFSAKRLNYHGEVQKVKLPSIDATEEHLQAYDEF